MKISNITLLWKKEMRELFRDKKTLITIFLPILIYPILAAFIVGGTALMQDNLNKKLTRVSLSENIPVKFKKMITEDKKLNIISNSENVKEALKMESIDVAIDMFENKNKERYNVYYSSTIERSEKGFKRLKSVFENYTKDLQDENIKKENINIPIMNLVEIKKNQLAEDSDFVGMILGMVLPFIITLYSIVGVVTMSADLTAGEKERGTLETIFASPIKKIEIITGKLFASMSVGILSTLANLMALFPAIIFVMIKFPEFDLTISPWIFILCFFMLIPIMTIVSSVIIGVGLFANSFREAQSYIAPIL
ncbi:MAG: ABC transporter permease subunit, partial [Fusobacteriota bacterium]